MRTITKYPNRHANGVLFDLADRLLIRSTRTGNCWQWIGPNNGKGYGQLLQDGRLQLAHRLSFQVFKGNIPDGMQVCHHCDNRGCINPQHLFLGTNLDNVRDKVNKGRHLLKFCKNGHEFTPENTYLKGEDRNCRTCREARNARYARVIKQRKATKRAWQLKLNF